MRPTLLAVRLNRAALAASFGSWCFTLGTDATPWLFASTGAFALGEVLLTEARAKHRPRPTSTSPDTCPDHPCTMPAGHTGWHRGPGGPKVTYTVPDDDSHYLPAYKPMSAEAMRDPFADYSKPCCEPGSVESRDHWLHDQDLDACSNGCIDPVAHQEAQ